MNTAEHFWHRPFSPYSHINKVKPLAVRDALIALFARWGLPGAIKVDNGEPFGDPMRKSIPTLALWLISLDITVIWNRPNQPTDNAIVERMQRTSQRWAEATKCADYQDLNYRLADVALIQREQYDVSRLGYQTRLEKYPELGQVTPVNAYEQFDAQRAYAYLAQVRLVRRIGKSGSLSINGYAYYIGPTHAGKQVSVKFDTDRFKWLIYDQHDEYITELEAKTLTPAHIWSIAVTRKEASTFCRDQALKL